MKISIVTIAYNEEGNILPLHNSIKECLAGFDYELIFVNDGSTDRTLEVLEKIKDEKLKIINFDKNRGKAKALYAGLQQAKNEIIATLDSDLQNNPADIIKLLKRLEPDCDFVCGWRQQRKDGIVKIISSIIGNFINNKILKIELHDNVCPLKVFKKKCIERIIYFENFHRFLPILAKLQDYNVCEEKVRHYPRLYGKSKYGIHNRIFSNLKTLFTIKFNKDKFFKI